MNKLVALTSSIIRSLSTGANLFCKYLHSHNVCLRAHVVILKGEFLERYASLQVIHNALLTKRRVFQYQSNRNDRMIVENYFYFIGNQIKTEECTLCVAQNTRVPL